jgi:tRNA pseudouridine38-40 synthase
MTVADSPSDSPVRLRLDLAYDGTAFSGWAGQPGRRSVEGDLAAALGTLLRAGDPLRLTVAGRTDAGVHARGQVAHVDVDAAAYRALAGRGSRTPEQALVARLAGVLPADLVVREVACAPTGFDARFSATSRRYSYRIADAYATRDPLRRHETLWWRHPLDADAMTRSGAELVGLHDFAAFCRRREGATTVRTLLEFAWTRGSDGVLEARVVADAFCHNMVRSLVGAVVAVGQGRHPPSWPAEVLVAGQRSPQVRVMPPHGLCLEQVSYPPDDRLVERAAEARSPRTVP